MQKTIECISHNKLQRFMQIIEYQENDYGSMV